MSDITDIFTCDVTEKYVPKGLSTDEKELIAVGHYVVGIINEKCSKWAGHQVNYQGLYNDFLTKIDNAQSTQEKNKLMQRIERKLENYLTRECEEIISLYYSDMTHQMSDHPF